MIITNNEELLRVKCDDVLPEEIGHLRMALENELHQSKVIGRPGIGLAAPQIGIAKKMAIVRIGNNLNLDLVNCKIEKQYDSFIHQNEGCLSFPGRVENILRYQEIYIKNNLIFPNAMILSGLIAICAQHELDHINGILLPDKAIKPEKMNKKIKPNEPCYCGEMDLNTNKIKKYKKCHGR